MRRIYFLVPDLESAHKVTEELLLARIEERHIHVIAKEGVELGDLPEASLLQTSDVIPAVERGLAVGGVTGVLAGVAAVTFPPAGLALGGGAVLATALVGSGMGAWMASMIGVDVKNTQITQFEEAVEQGEIIIRMPISREQSQRFPRSPEEGASFSLQWMCQPVSGRFITCRKQALFRPACVFLSMPGMRRRPPCPYSA